MRFFPLFFFLLIPSFVLSEYLTSYEAVMAKAEETNKIPMIVMVSKNCPYCKRLKKNTLTDPEVLGFLEKKFVVGLLDKDKDTYPERLCSSFVPMTYFLDYTGDSIWQSAGYKSPERFIVDLYEVLKLWSEFYASN